MDVTETIIQDSATGRLYLWVSCEGPIPFPMNVPDCSLGVPMAPFLVPTASRGGLWNLVAPFEDGST